MLGKRNLGDTLNRGYMWNKIILKQFCNYLSVFISHVITPQTGIKVGLFQPPKEFWNYFKIISATMNMLENVHERNNFEIILFHM